MDENMNPGYPMPYLQPAGMRSPAPAAPRTAQPFIQNAPALTQTGFRTLSKEEKSEEERIALEAAFSYDGYQVVRREFFAHKFDPAITIRDNSVVFNTACISRLEDVVYVQFLINPQQEKLVIRPCGEDAKDAVRWCIAKNEKRKSRQITCQPFTNKLFDMMGWETLYRYKLLGVKIDFKGEFLYVFDLASTEVYLPQTKPDEPGAKPIRRPPYYPADWRDSFGIPVAGHAALTQIDLLEGYDTMHIQIEGMTDAGSGPDAQTGPQPKF